MINKNIKVIELCNKIGIYTMQELKRFLKEEQQKHETTCECLKRYYNSIGGEHFKIIA